MGSLSAILPDMEHGLVLRFCVTWDPKTPWLGTTHIYGLTASWVRSSGLDSLGPLSQGLSPVKVLAGASSQGLTERPAKNQRRKGRAQGHLGTQVNMLARTLTHTPTYTHTHAVLRTHAQLHNTVPEYWNHCDLRDEVRAGQCAGGEMPRDRAAWPGIKELVAGACGFSKPHASMDGQHSEEPHCG